MENEMKKPQKKKRTKDNSPIVLIDADGIITIPIAIYKKTKELFNIFLYPGSKDIN